MQSTRLIRRYVGYLIPLVSAVLVVSGGIWAVNSELREKAATAAYSAYLEALFLRDIEGVGLTYKDHKDRSLAAARFLLYSDDQVIKEAASLYAGKKDENGYLPGVIACSRTKQGTKETYDRHMYQILLAMRKDVGRSGNFSFEEYNAILCTVWPK